MSPSDLDYKLLYEQSQQKLAQTQERLSVKEQQLSYTEQNLSRAQQELSFTEQKLQLALLEINELRAKLFGSKSDQRVKKAAGKELDILPLGVTPAEVVTSEALFKGEVAAAEQSGQKVVEKRAKAATTRMVLPDHLEREEVIIDPQGDLSGYQIIGEEVTEVLVLLPASFKVKRIIRRKWALKNNHHSESKGVVIAPIPSRTVKRGLFDESLLAYLLISKYEPANHEHLRFDHLPLYRQKKIFEREGIYIPSSTLNDNTAAACGVLKPLYHALKRELLANLYLQADETTIKVLESEKKGACHLGYYWVYHAPVDGIVIFDYGPQIKSSDLRSKQGRGQEGPRKMLTDFSGVLQSDGYGVYGALFKNSDTVNQLYCMAHIRRKFDETVNYDKDRATYAVESIGKLYALEKHIREAILVLSEDEIVALRRKGALPILDTIKAWLLAEYPKVLPQSPIGKAIAYALPLWDKMYAYTLHGHLQIDNNAIENAIRPVALGRKNYLFAGTHHTAQNAAMIYSLFSTCHKHAVNPQVWLIDVLQKINDPHYEGKFSDLLPHRWKNNPI